MIGRKRVAATAALVLSLGFAVRWAASPPGGGALGAGSGEVSDAPAIGGADAEGGRALPSALPKGRDIVTASGVRLRAELLRPPKDSDATISGTPLMVFSPPGEATDDGIRMDQGTVSPIDALLGFEEGSKDQTVRWLSISAVLTEPQMEVVRRQLKAVARPEMGLAEGDAVEVVLGDTRMLCSLEPGGEGYTIEAELRVERGDSRAPAMGITVWDGQSILFSNPEGGSDLLSLKLSLKNPAPLQGVSMSDDPFVE